MEDNEVIVASRNGHNSLVGPTVTLLLFLFLEDAATLLEHA